MTKLTRVAGRRMVAGFAGRTADPIMTTGIAAAAGKLAMIKGHLQPSAGAGVTRLTRRIGRDMVRSFAGGDGAIMTPRASISGLAVIDRS